MKFLLLYNPRSGSADLTSEDFKRKILDALNSDNSKSYEVEFIDIIEESIEEENFKNKIKDFDAVIISGGDGTISSNLKYVVENDIPLGIIPNGTFNNFARDNKIPLETKEALNAIKEFNTIEIDAGKLNGKYFINNSSIGLYTASVKVRERTREKYKMNKLTAMFLAVIRIFYLFPMIYVEVVAGDKKFKKKTPFVFIGNNNYDFDLFSLGARKTLREGMLYVYYSKCRFRICLLKIGLKALLSKLRDEKDFITLSVKEIMIYSKRKKITVAADGEIYKMDSPLKYQILPKAIKLLVPLK